MSASPRFWQKLGLRKQTKSTCSDKQENEFMHSSFSFHNLPTVTNNTDNDNSGNQVKHFSNKGKQHHLLRHSASSVSVLCPQSSNFITEKKTVKRASSKIKSIKQTSMEAQQQERANFSFNRTSLDLSSQQQAKLFTPTPYQQTNSPTKIQPYTDTSIANSKLSPPRIVRTKSNQSSVSVPANSSRLPQPAVANVQTKQLLRSESNSSLASFNAQIVMRKKRSFPKIDQSVTVNNGNSGGEDDENKSSCLTRTSSNGSTSTAEKRRSNSNRQRISTPERRKSSGNTQQQEDEESVIGLLREELEKEKTFSRSLQRQKEAIAKDLDYFCKLADDVADEKEEFKRKYEEEKLQNELLRNIIAEIEPNNGITSDKDDNNDINARLIAAVSHSRADLVDLQQQVVNENHLHKQALESKDNEISKLKTDLQQTQKQIQILRKTMEQLLKADGKTLSDDIHDFNEELTRKQSISFMMIEQKYQDDNPNDKYPFLRASYYPDQHTSPPTPTPQYPLNNTEESHQEQQYNELKTDNNIDNQQRPVPSRVMPEDFSKKMEISKMRKEQLKEMLGEVDSQLNRVKQKIRPSFDT